MIVLAGGRAAYNFSATYKVSSDAFFLRHLAEESIVIDIVQASSNRFINSCCQLLDLL